MRRTKHYQISLAHEYSGLGKDQTLDYDGGVNEYRMALAADPSNADAKRLLKESLRRQEASSNGSQFNEGSNQGASIQTSYDQGQQQTQQASAPSPTPEQQEKMAGSLAYQSVYGVPPLAISQSEADSRWRELCRRSGVGDPDAEERDYDRLSQQKQAEDSNPQPPMNLMGN